MQIDVANQQSALPVDEDRLRAAAAAALGEAEPRAVLISLAVVDDPTIHELNRRHLDHDYPTDVLSFSLADGPDGLEGEVIVSADTAIANAREYAWPAEHELLLYVVHGVLHLIGFGDKSDEEAVAMRRAEARCLARLGIAPPVATPGGAPT